MTPPITPPMTPPESAADLSYEQAREELIETVRLLEAGGTSLADSLALWERGEQLATVCERFLDGVRERLDAVVSATGDD